MAFLLAILAVAQAQAIDEKRVQELVEKCGAEAITDREAAARELMAMGEPVLPILEKILKGSIPTEARAGAQKVIEELTIPARWVKDVVEGDWNQVYQRLDQILRNKELERPTIVRIYTAILMNDNVTPDQRQAVLQIASNQRFRELWPAVLQLLQREDPYQNYGHYLQQLRPPREAAGAILKVIPKVQNYNAVYQLLELARSMKPERAAMEECLTAIIEGDDANIKSNTLGLIQQGRYAVSLRVLLKWWRDQPSLKPYALREAVLRSPPGDDVADVVALLKSGQADDVTLAIEYIGRQRVAGAAPGLAQALEERPELKVSILQAFRSIRCEDEVRQWVTAGSGPGRRAALALVTELGWSAAAPEVSRALGDEDPAVRREAAVAAGALRIAESKTRLEELLRDGDGGVRRAALVSLAMIQRRDATRTALAYLKSDDPDLQAAAVEALPFVDPEQTLAALTTDEAVGRGITRHALAVLIVKNGPSMLHRVMARVQGRISPDDLHAQIRLVQSVAGR